VSANRKLHFKSAEAWLKYQMEFGDYLAANTFDNMVDKIVSPLVREKSFIAEFIVSNLGNLGRSIGVLETMSTNPELMLKSLKNVFMNELQQLATKQLATKDGSILQQLDILKNANSFNNQLELMLGIKPQVPQVEAILGAYRSWKCMANLGSTVISSFPDSMTFVSELQNNGIPVIQSYANLLQVVTTAFNAKEKKEFGSLLGVGVDSLLGNSYSRLRAEYPVAGSIAKLTNAFFRLNCMEWWDNSWKTTMGNLLSHNLAVQVNKPFSSLYHNLQTLLSRYGINESNWHFYKHLVQQIDNKPYLIPDMELLPDHLLDQYLQKQVQQQVQQQGKNDSAMTINSPNKTTINNLNRTRLKQDLTNNLRRYLIDRVDTAIPTPHTAERNALLLGNLGIKARSPAAAVVQCIMQFKSFAYTYITRPLKSITIDQIPIDQQLGSGSLFDHSTWQDIAKSLRNPTTLRILPQLLLGTTLLGYLSINAARLLRGQQLLSPKDSGVFTASLLKGGGLGLYGDFIFGEFDRYSHNLLEALLGPIGSDVIDIGKIYSKAKNGELDQAENLTKKLLERNIPGRNLFYLQPALFMIE
jgi:hypothetical protein